MTQVAGAVSSSDAVIWVSSNGSSFTDISGALNTLNPSGGGRMTGQAYTAAGDNPLPTSGKRQFADVTVSIVYTEAAGEPFQVVRALYEANSPLWIRWAPKGGQTGESIYTAGPGVFGAFNWPGLNEASADPIMVGFAYHGPEPIHSIAT